MSGEISGVVGAVVEYALDGLSVRQAAISTNIANANTPGYRPIRVSFDEQLSLLAAGGKSGLAALTPPQVFVEKPGGKSAHALLEHELIELNRNVLLYQALITGLEKYRSMTNTAIMEGRR